MANSYFQFKQFTISQDKCAMKVGTDGVLLGAWTSLENTGRILDVGTGSGLIALMAAQRSGAFIDAIDLDADACRQADENIQASPFAKRIKLYHTTFASYCSSTGERYDRIISNPPYFHASLKGPDGKRNTARHTDTLPLEELISGSRKLLAESGRIALILPYDQEERLLQIVSDNHLYPVRLTRVLPIPEASPKRILMEIALHPLPDLRPETLTIELSRHQYTPAYIELTRDFYLNM